MGEQFSVAQKAASTPLTGEGTVNIPERNSRASVFLEIFLNFASGKPLNS
jgi:hypothetical protein